MKHSDYVDTSKVNHLHRTTETRRNKIIVGGKFSPHTDGRRLASLNEQSFMTINIYLNDVPEEHGGATRFLSPTSEVLSKVQPTLGQAALFRDDLWHDGEELLSGVKYLLRTDVMYVRKTEFDFERLYGALNDEGKGRKALGIAEGLEDAGRGTEAVGWYKRAFGLWEALER
jgi:2OG-Fe(II) oxygenase superfamily